MFIRYGIKKVTYGLVILVAISSIEVRCSSYDYLKSTLPYAAVLAFIATNYYRRSVAQPSNTYDDLSYALPVVAAGAGSLLAQPDNWRGAFVRSLPAMIFALGAMGLERINAPKLSGNNAVIVTSDLPPKPVSLSLQPDQKTENKVFPDEPITFETRNLPQHTEAVSLSPQRDQEIENKAISGEPSALVTSDLPIEPVSPSLDQKIVQTHQDQPPIGQKVETPEDLIRYFFEKKNELAILGPQYNHKINQIDDIIDNIFSNVVQTKPVLQEEYAQANQYYEKLQAVYAELQTLANNIKQGYNDQEKINHVDTLLKPIVEDMSEIVDPVRAVALAAYANALINLYIKVGQNEEIYKRPIIELMPEVLEIQDFFSKHGLSFSYDVTDLIKTVEPLVIKRLGFFKNADQKASELLNDFLALNTRLNGYLKDNKKNEFRDNFKEIENYYNSMNTWYQDHKQEIELMNSRVAHIFETNLLLDRVNVYKNMGDMAGTALAGLCYCFVTASLYNTQEKEFYLYTILLQARKDKYINQNQYDQLNGFIDQVKTDVLQKVINLLGEYINWGRSEEVVPPVGAAHETTSGLSQGRHKRTGRRR